MYYILTHLFGWLYFSLACAAALLVHVCTCVYAIAQSRILRRIHSENTSRSLFLLESHAILWMS